MFIKRVVIEGFKSYLEQIVTEDFSPKVNCVVGDNGSGKTEFFHAIRFVLSDLFQNLCSEDRNALQHKAAGHPVLSAFVEIVFDNSDNRIPVDKGEVHLRWMIGSKKDKYLIDGKNITKTEVMNLLESAGFSCSNSYYVVQQGKIASLTLMKDSERLDLLKEIGGARVYEEKRCEYLRIMQETGKERTQIIEVLQDLDKSLKELDVEKDELRKYQKLYKHRKSLQYAIYNKEVQDAQLNLAKIKEARTNVTEMSSKKYKEFLHVLEKSKNLKNYLEDITKEHQNFIEQKEVIEKQQTTAFKKRTELALDVKDLQDKISRNELAKGDDDSLHVAAKSKRQELRDAKRLVDDASYRLKNVSKRINNLNREIAKTKDEINKLMSSENEFNRTVWDDAKELEQLEGKGRTFSDKKNKYTKKISELGPLTPAALEKYKKSNIKDLQKKLPCCNDQLLLFDQYIKFTEQRKELQKRRAELDAGDEKIRVLISVLDQQMDESIERTFKGVARHFQEVFSELVQGGHGHLVMMNKDGDHDDDDQDEDGPREVNPEGRVEKYIGVKVKVCFTGQGETQTMKQLSGGKKIVVALTLIFAIQRCDPASFYLFDEIDAALDPQYRTAVGNMIRRLADITNTQLITTTFHPELVKVADKIFGVRHENKVSRVNVISEIDALELINQDSTQC